MIGRKMVVTLLIIFEGKKEAREKQIGEIFIMDVNDQSGHTIGTLP